MSADLQCELNRLSILANDNWHDVGSETLKTKLLVECVVRVINEPLQLCAPSISLLAKGLPENTADACFACWPLVSGNSKGCLLILGPKDSL